MPDSPAASEFDHTPVMLTEVMDLLRPEEGGPYWDLTLGAGGHLAGWLDRAPADDVAYGLDGDPAALPRARYYLGDRADRAVLAHGDLGTLEACADWPRPRAILMDVGLSSPQVDDPDRGFSYRHEGPLDMRMDPTRGPTAAEWLEDIDQKSLQNVLSEYGEERYSGRIARVIKESLPLHTTQALCEAVIKAVPRRDPRHHPARRTFQAIRIAVNRELERIETGLQAAIEALVPGGRVVVLSYHSGEDRVAKNVFREHKRTTLTLLTKKPVECSRDEARTNPRARSVKLRAAEKR